MSKTSRVRNAFTLIEVLIVVVIMAILAATIIPQFSSSTEDAKDSTLEFNLHTLQSQIEMYKVHHLASYPNGPDDSPTFSEQLTEKTNADGSTAADGDYGPYITGEIPDNPFVTGDRKNEVDPVGTPGTEPTAVVDGGAGWQYDNTTGRIYPNNSEYYE